MKSFNPDYSPPWYFQNGHLSTAYAGLLRKRGPEPAYERERLNTPDGDFIDVDIMRRGHSRAVILLHGLEGDSRRPYMVRMANRLLAEEFDVLALNFRGCSGEPNRLLQSYHTGATTDLRFLIKWLEAGGIYSQLALVGFSLGGNVVLKYLGEEGETRSANIMGAVAFSVPIHLASSSRQLDRGINRIYVNRFLNTLIPKALHKMGRMDHNLDEQAIRRSGTFAEFDEAFTAPVNGFRGALDYWENASSLPWLDRINCPALLVNAQDDPFLSPECYPRHRLQNHEFLHFESPRFGGHVGFPGADQLGFYWSEHRAAHFLNQLTRQEVKGALTWISGKPLP